MLEPGHLPFESGVKRLADGKLYVAVLTPMPNITREMLVHWFSTMKTFERYKMWHPLDHVSFESVDRPGTQGEHEYLVQENIGGKLQKLSIRGLKTDAALDTSRFDAAGVVLCRFSQFSSPAAEKNWTGHILHLARETGYGVEMRSRFWISDEELGAPPAAANEDPPPDSFGISLFKHCSEEMSYLAGLLPGLYKRETGVQT